jgi:sialate O-acetylesterase
VGRETRPYAGQRRITGSDRARENKKTELKVADVLVGEVWLGSGQSNMAMQVSDSRDFDTEKAAANLPLVRMFKENSGASAEPQLDAKGQWSVCSPQSVGLYSATLYFFGRDIYRDLKVPVGLINSSVGGTPIES